MQNGFTAIEKCKFPVIAAVHGACVGGGVDLISACDIRYCTSDAIFSVKEVDLAIPADMGTLQRLPKITGNHSLVREWCFTGKTFTASDAMNVGLVSRIFESKEKMFEEAMKTAIEIGSKSPVATLGTKHLLNYSRDHTVDEGLNYTALWNSAMIHTEDVTKSIEAAKKKNLPKFSKL
ncbi:putative enoyl CoA hydratase [Nowakowskiella sp. JEL0407]|nr:putative enoyl CoA hydratase [Nowakowskiella sp. JEL0407]